MPFDGVAQRVGVADGGAEVHGRVEEEGGADGERHRQQRGRREAISRLLMEFEDDADALRAALSEDDAGRTPSEIAAAAGHDATAAVLARAEAAVVVARREGAERRALRRRKAAIACVLVGLAALRRFRRRG